MKSFVNNIKIRKPFGNITRNNHVLLIIKDDQGNFLIGDKPDFYPKGIYRLAGGGVEEGETPHQSAIRETKEELSLSIDQRNLKLIAQITTNAKIKEQTLSNITYLFQLVGINPKEIVAGDDIVGLKPFSKEEFKQLIEKYNNLGSDNIYDGEDGYSHFWDDYGKMYSFIHQVALDLSE